MGGGQDDNAVNDAAGDEQRDETRRDETCCIGKPIIMVVIVIIVASSFVVIRRLTINDCTGSTPAPAAPRTPCQSLHHLPHLLLPLTRRWNISRIYSSTQRRHACIFHTLCCVSSHVYGKKITSVQVLYTRPVDDYQWNRWNEVVLRRLLGKQVHDIMSGVKASSRKSIIQNVERKYSF